MKKINESVRYIEPQSESEGREITGDEAEYILRKNGYYDNELSSIESHSNEIKPKKDLTFEEMIQQHKQKEKIKRDRESQKRNGINPKGFDTTNGFVSKKVSGTTEDGISFTIDIVSDMKI